MWEDLTDNRIVMSKAQNRKKKGKKYFFKKFLKQNMVSEEDKSNTEVEKQTPVQEQKQ